MKSFDCLIRDILHQFYDIPIGNKEHERDEHNKPNGVHGFGEFDKYSYILNTLLIRYLQKAGVARLPLGFGTLIGGLTPTVGGFLLKTLKGKEYADEHTWWASKSQQKTRSVLSVAYDEQRIWMRIHSLKEAGLLSPDLADILEAEVGGRPQQALWDGIRSYLPWVYALAVIAGVVKGTQDQEEK